MAISKRKKNRAKQTASMVYVGPNMGGALPMTQYTVYRNGLPKLVQSRYDSDPDFKRLFCPVEELDDARAELRKTTSVRSRAYGAVLKSKIERSE